MIALVAIFCMVLLGAAGNAGARQGLVNSLPKLAPLGGSVERESVTRQSVERGTCSEALTLHAATARPALLRITMAEKDLFDPQRGIYSNPTNRGAEWERPASVELVYPDGREGFRAHCGLRIHGGLSRQPQESPKHSFRLVFKRRYGVGHLRFPLFGAGGAQQFETLVLRAGYNDSWLHTDSQARRRASYLRDEWMRESMAALGYPSARGIFVQLYLNGQYWGLYNLCERPDASFVAANEGGSAQDYDCRKGSEIISGDEVAWNKMMALAESGLDAGGAFEKIRRVIDLTEFADYMILNFYAGNSDWDRNSNWYAARRRTGKFQFLVWDAECTLGGIADCTIDFDDEESPPGLFHQLCYNPEFRRLFAERVQRLFFDGGPLSAEASRTRYRALAREIEAAIGQEAVRWGSYRREVHLDEANPNEGFALDDQWRAEVKRMLTEYFPHRAEIVLKQFRERGLYPAAGALGLNGQRGNE